MQIIKVAIFALFMFSCGQEKTGDAEKVKQEVRIFLEEYHQAMETEGLLSEFRFLDDHEDFFWVPPGYESSLGYDSVKTILTQMAPQIKRMHLEWEYLHIYPHTEHLATFTGKLHSRTTMVDGNTIVSSALETGLVVRRADGWKLLNGQSRTIE